VDKISAGIDLGTTNSCLAILQGDRPVVFANDLDEPTTPSVVSIQPDRVIIGKPARKFLLSDPVGTFASMKRKMGQQYRRNVQGKEYSPEMISALILRHLKECGERRLGSSLDDVVITVPAHFDSRQRQATRDAGQIAGFNVLRVLNEPTAAALAYGHMNQLSAFLVVFDLGGGTFDLSVVEAGDGVFEVIYSAGDNHLGGDDFNLRIANWIVEQFQQHTGLDIRRDIPALSLVHEWAISAKHALSKASEARVRIDGLYQDRGFDAVLSRALLESLCTDLFERLRVICRKVIDELQATRYRQEYGNVFANRLEQCNILLVGGETRVPAIQQLVWQAFKGKVLSDADPDEVVAQGAALQAGIIHQKGEIKDVILLDRTAFPLGIQLVGGFFSPVIEGHTRIPCSRSETYFPVADYAPSVLIEVYQGEHERCLDNVKLAEFEFPLDPPRLRQEAALEVTFQLDVDDILHVSAVDKATGAQQGVIIRGSQNLDQVEVENLRRETSERHSFEGPAGAGTVACAHCGATLPAGFAFCGKCGMPLKKDTCGRCGAALVEGFQFCGRCGAKVAP